MQAEPAWTLLDEPRAPCGGRDRARAAQQPQLVECRSLAPLPLRSGGNLRRRGPGSLPHPSSERRSLPDPVGEIRRIALAGPAGNLYRHLRVIPFEHEFDATRRREQRVRQTPSFIDARYSEFGDPRMGSFLPQPDCRFLSSTSASIVQRNVLQRQGGSRASLFSKDVSNRTAAVRSCESQDVPIFRRFIAAPMMRHCRTDRCHL